MSKLYCQSCGMPLYSPEQFGTDANGIFLEEYCIYCFKEGKYTSNVTMDEMIQLCARYVKPEVRDSYVKQMKVRFPSLKRWAQKEDTQNEYHKSINKVLDYIDENLSENPDLEKLSQIANISPFHFHRIFKAIIGENTGEYIQRLRLEYVAGKLRTTSLTLSELAENSGYNSEQALSKAFRKYFGMPPSIYKKTSDKWTSKNNTEIIPRICKIASRNVIYLRIIDEYGSPKTYNTAWKKLYVHAILNGLFSESSESLGISFNDPGITANEKCRFYACISVDKQAEPTGEFGSKTIEGGLYAIFTMKGHYSGLYDFYKQIWFGWLPQSKYRLRKAIFFEKYVNNPNKVKKEDILTEIYIPVREK